MGRGPHTFDRFRALSSRRAKPKYAMLNILLPKRLSAVVKFYRASTKYEFNCVHIYAVRLEFFFFFPLQLFTLETH